MARVQTLLLAAAALVLAEDASSTPKPKKVLDTIMTPAYIPVEEKHGSFWKSKAQDALKAKIQIHPNKNKAKNGILFIGDGMSLPTIMAARTYGGQLERELGEDNVLHFEKFPISGLARTYCIDAQVPDSACTATSYLTGVKTKYGVIGLDGNVTRGSCHSQLHKGNWAQSIGQWALQQGLDVGLVTTTRVTHASPAGMYAHVSERNWESDADVPEECISLGCRDIANQLITSDPGRQFKVVMGGGRREFLPNVSSVVKSTGRRLDNSDLIELWHVDKRDKNVSHQYVTDRVELMKVFNSDDLPEYLLGLFNDDHMDYHLKAQNQPTLEEMVEIAIKMLSRSPKGYFLFVEGGRIDHAHHDSQAYLALDETVEYAKAIKKAESITNEQDTLIVVSADHAHTMTVAGYPSRGNDILGVVDTARGMDGIPYTTISYANGKANSIGADGKRVDVTLSKEFQSRDYGYSYPSLVPLDSETHGGEDVAVFASGPWSHLFTSSFEQNAIPHFMAYAMCLTNDHHINCRVRNHRNGFWTSSAVHHKPVWFLSICAVIISLRMF
ncbi:membrane-bound alkaline phosphatase-like isoform X2 [Pectinophora gossypiella]|uniref:membrane-bound alkaline phosphatase-like isoform X2 n=1 Tax=Pectinophora gossypiella TaxID=13191 RepID=UPI00214E6AF7|nr:membrane-bound alkaline phosphatase-like isoform X2 [Pectinophora gossypiella]